MKNDPTIFHITHYKAGSQWVAEVLKRCAAKRIVLPEVGTRFPREKIRPGAIYPTVYATKQDFDSIIASTNLSYRKFLVIRDLRDVLISLYFSLKISHPLQIEKHRKRRQFLQGVSEACGLIYLMDEVLDWHKEFQLSWLNDENLLFLKYENLLAREYAIFGQIMKYCQIDVDWQYLHKIVAYNSFEAITGRKRGQEDVRAHQRKGIVGDWRNHFSKQVKDEFKKRFGEVLIKTGYENDLMW